MIRKETLVLIPARGGSKGVPKKNTRLLLDKPLIQYTLEFSSEFFSKEDICISTDSVEIKTVVERLGYEVPFLRPDALATDYAGTREVILHALDYYRSLGIDYKYVLLLQPTTPLRDYTVYDKVQKMKSSGIIFDMIVSVRESKANPYFNLFEEDEDGFLMLSKKSDYVRRQDCPKIYEYNGAFYLINASSLRDNEMRNFKRICKVINNETAYSIDIDTPEDWEKAEILIDRYFKEK